MKTILTTFLIFLNLTSPLLAEDRVGSIHDMKINFKTEKNKPATLADFKGKKVVMAMMYTTCHGACPMIFQKLNKIQEKLDAQNIKADFVLVTFDPNGDTPEKMSAFRKRTGINKDNWTFLTGKDADIRRFSLLMNVRYSKNPESGEIMHDNKIFLVSEAGNIIKTLDGLDADISNLF